MLGCRLIIYPVQLAGRRAKTQHASTRDFITRQVQNSRFEGLMLLGICSPFDRGGILGPRVSVVRAVILRQKRGQEELTCRTLDGTEPKHEAAEAGLDVRQTDTMDLYSNFEMRESRQQQDSTRITHVQCQRVLSSIRDELAGAWNGLS